MKVGIYGGTGRVGNMLISLLQKSEDLKLSSVYVVDKVNFTVDESVLITNSIEEFLKHSDVVIDFTIAKGTENLLEKATNFKPTPLVIGTTGLSVHQQNLLKNASLKMPVFYATNMSLGVAILNKVTFEVAKTLRDFDVEICEMHHKGKKDSPSGTALTLASNIAKARDLDLNSVRVSGRDGNIGERKKDEIAVMSLRGGDVIGEHTVGFYADGEFLRFSHTATNRKVFAIGAIKAAKWLLKKENGLYSINDLLFSKSQDPGLLK